MSDPFGFLNINKSLGMTSHDVINRVRRGLKIKKAGHAGTLDPLASGVLIVCCGSATRLSEYIMQSTKRYRATVHLGVTTETYDAEGEALETRSIESITQNAVQRVLGAFTGDQEQVPPMYSAIKQEGRKLYELARAGQTVERPARHIQIESLTLLEWEPPRFTLDVICSPGTYIRSLAHDIGESLGVGAHLSALERTASGAFTVEDAVPLDALIADDAWQQWLITPDQALAHWPALHLTPEDSEHILHGRVISRDSETTEYARAYTPEGQFIAVLQAAGARWRPHKVFPPES